MSTAIDIRNIIMNNKLLKSVFDSNNVNDLDIHKNGTLIKDIDLKHYFKENIKQMQEESSFCDIVFSFDDDNNINMNKLIVWYHCPFLRDKIENNDIINVEMESSYYNMFRFLFKYIYTLDYNLDHNHIDDCNIIIDIYLYGSDKEDKLGKAINDLYIKCKWLIEEDNPPKTLMIQLFNRLTSYDMKKNETMLEYVYNKIKYYEDINENDFTDNAIEILKILGWK